VQLEVTGAEKAGGGGVPGGVPGGVGWQLCRHLI